MKAKIVSLLALLVIFYAAPVRAFGISPVKTLITADSPSSQTVYVNITNTDEKDVEFRLGVLGLNQDNEGYPNFGRGLSEAENWVYPESSSVLVRPGQTTKTSFIVKIPEKILPGSYYVGLFAEPTPSQSKASGVKPRMISILTIEVAGEVSEEMIVERWVPKKAFFADKMWLFDLDVKNTGLVEVPVAGMVSVKNWRGQDKFSQEIALGNKLISGSKRSLLPFVSIEKKIRLPGYYQAELKIHYGLTRQIASAVVGIWYLPWWSFVAITFFALVLISLILFFRKK